MDRPTFRLSDYRSFVREVALFLGWGPGPWTPEQWAVLKSCVRAGLRNSLYPHPVSDG